MLTEEEFREELHRRVGPRLAEVQAPADLVDGVRVRQARRTAVLRGTTAASVVGIVVAVVSVSALWPKADTGSPSAPLPSAQPSSGAHSVTPTPASSGEPSIAAVAPLVTSGPCAGLNVAAYLPPAGLRHPVLTVRREGTVLSLTGTATDANLAAKGPCAERLWYVPRTSAIQGANGIDQPSLFERGGGWIKARPAAANQTGVVQLFLDCKGLVCSDSGAPLATILVQEQGTAPGAASLPFPPAPSPIPPPTGEAVIVPSVVGMTVEAATRLLLDDGLGVGCNCFGGVADTRIVTAQDLPAGTTAHRGGVSIGIVASGPAPRPSLPPRAPTSGVATPSAPHSAGPSLAATSSRMPSVVGLSVGEAERVLAKAGLTYQATYRFSSAPKDTVTYQNPSAGAAVLPSTVVAMTVGLGPQPQQ